MNKKVFFLKKDVFFKLKGMCVVDKANVIEY